MKRAIFSCLMIVMVIGLTGCVSNHGRHPSACTGGSCAQAPEACASCEGAADGNGDPCVGDPGDECASRGHACRLFHPCRSARGGGEGAGAGTAPVGAVTYPYYTTRGPRDFLAKNPPSIGP